MHRITRRLSVALVAAGLLLAVGCAKDETLTTAPTTTPVTAVSGGGGDKTDGTTPDDADEDADKDKGSGSYDEACSIIQDIDEVPEDDFEEAIALMGDARDASPDELADSWDVLIDVFDQLSAVESGSDAETTMMLELLEDPDFLAAAAAIDDFAEEECGIDIGLDPSEESDAPGGRTGDDEIGAPTDDDPTSIDAVQAYLASIHGDEVWWPVLDDASAWGSSGSSDVLWTITLSSSSDWEALTAKDLESACNAISGYLLTNGDYSGFVEIEILDPDETVLVSKVEDGDCEAA